MRYKIPSKWTKDDFAFATWLAALDSRVNDYDIVRDLQDCVIYGFKWACTIGFLVNYAMYANEVANREK